MKCAELEMLLSAYIDGEVTPEEHQMVERHLSRCAACRNTMAQFAAIHTLYQNLEVKAAPPDFRQQVTQRLEGRSRCRWAWPRLAAVLSFVLLLVVAGALVIARVAHQPASDSVRQAGLEIDVYAEEVLFDSVEVQTSDAIFSIGQPGVAEDILETMDALTTPEHSSRRSDNPRRPNRLWPVGLCPETSGCLTRTQYAYRILTIARRSC
jgi:anti-sigma factor RsiW